MTILDPRYVFQPFEYPEAYDYWLRQQQAHWLHTEVAMASDIHDWNVNLTDSERNVIGNILKSFAQTEVIVNDYWSTRVAHWFPKPEIAMMSSAFGNMETVHAKAYAYLNESLGLDNFQAFLDEPTAKDKLDSLSFSYGNQRVGIATSLAVFSAFTEGVQLFSSFAVLMNFGRFNKLKGVGQIVAFSIKDESLHSEAGCWLFRQFIKEFPAVLTPRLRETVLEAARLSIKLEDDFIDKAFELGPIEGLNPKDLKQYIRYRTNTKLGDLGFASNWRNINQESLEAMEWFDFLSTGLEHQDFFSGRVTGYSRGVVDFSTIDWASSNGY